MQANRPDVVLNGEVIETYFHPSQRNQLWRELEKTIAERSRSIELRNVPADAAMRLSDQRMDDALREIGGDAPSNVRWMTQGELGGINRYNNCLLL